MVNFPINTGPKEDHPSRLLKLLGVDPKYYYKADELKLYEDAINALYGITSPINSNIAQVYATWTGTGLDFLCSGTNIPINEVFYNGAQETVTLDPNTDPTLYRIDLVGFFAPVSPATVGSFGFVKGDLASAEIVLPPDYDASLFYPIKPILVKNGATEPSNPDTGNVFNNVKIYAENAGEPTEWTTAVTANLVKDSVNTPRSGTYCIEATNVSYSDKSTFTFATPKNTNDLSELEFFIKLKATIHYAFIRIEFYLANKKVGRLTQFYTGTYGFNSYLLNEYQQIIINKTSLNLPTNETYDKILIYPYVNGHAGYFLDDISIKEGSGSVVNVGIGEAPVNDKYHLRRNAAWEDSDNITLTPLSPINKIITQADVTSFGGGDMLAVNNLSEVDPAAARTNLGLADAKTKTDFLTVTQPVDLDDIEIRVNNLDAAVVLKGGWDASVGTFPGAGVAQAGFSYQITAAGTVNGIDFSINDRIIALVDNASTTIYATNWLKADYSDLVASFNGRTGAIVLLNTDISDLMTASTAKTTLVDTDIFSLFDTVLKKVSWANIKANLKTYFDTLYQPIGGAADPSQITITTTVSITTDTVGNAGKTQKEKNVIIDNGTNAINITVNGGTNFLASYLKHGTGAITFVQGAGRTLALVDSTAVLDGAVGSTATISSIGTKDYLRISNA